MRMLSRELGTLLLGLGIGGFAPAIVHADVPQNPTFSQHIAPLFQAKCETCHRPGSIAPMSLQTFEQVRPWAKAIKTRTGLGPRAGG